MRDICPHRAARCRRKLVTGQNGAEVVECPTMLTFGPTVCAKIPSLVSDQEMDASRIRVRRYPAAESQGWCSLDGLRRARTGADQPRRCSKAWSAARPS